ncbi:MAG: MarR family transcriptional regulator [Gemmataceae bacterium]|nr:MarR family transcriptional regulator [Gemmataceae bacterium]
MSTQASLNSIGWHQELILSNTMALPAETSQFDHLAQQIVELNNAIALSQPRFRRQKKGLKEMEFLTLCYLRHRNSMNVGDIQKLLGVLPAQMSRIIRALENRENPYINCKINTMDKRKIDVVLTSAGQKAFESHQNNRVLFVQELVQKLAEDELDDLKRLVDRLTGIIVESSKTPINYTTVY